MKTAPAFWIIAGAAIGTSIGVAFGKIAAGFCLGTSIGILVMLVAFTEVERKKRNY